MATWRALAGEPVKLHTLKSGPDREWALRWVKEKGRGQMPGPFRARSRWEVKSKKGPWSVRFQS